MQKPVKSGRGVVTESERRSQSESTSPGGRQDGEERSAAFQAAIFPHLDTASTLARYLTRRSDFAEDIVQEALLRAFRGFDGFRGGDSRAWFLAIVRNCFLSWHDRSRRDVAQTHDAQTGAALSLAHPVSSDVDEETPEALLIRRDDSEAVRLLVEQLPYSFREVLVLRDVEDLSYREIAGALDMPIGTVMSRLARARKMLAAAWKGLEQTASEKEKSK